MALVLGAEAGVKPSSRSMPLDVAVRVHPTGSATCSVPRGCTVD